ncbi:helix-turn-helix transcriptional regulator [Salmonirosea aquatica]|uniref:LuxR family transcriptional regulator n=1 Tax=Salmonirosea aquatica TaxID=2654236 RepID=A0A7C9BEV9_9BACT|nr:LuxR family transcriptional regulator [Cytophagaceae bacterium SJW1-29]
MRVFGTDIHIVTFCFIVIEVVFFLYQLYYYLCWPKDQNRKYYLILLFLLIVKNLAMGLFPDPQYTNIPMVIQYAFTYAAGFIMASYFPYYFYRSYNLEGLRFHATYGVVLFLYLPFTLIFTTEYLVTGNIDNAIAHGLIIPAAYSLVLAYAMFRSVRKAFTNAIENHRYYEEIGMYCSVVPFVAIAFFPGIDQVTEAVITNAGFTILTVLFIRRSIIQARLDRAKLQAFEANETETPFNGIVDVMEQNIKVFEANMSLFKLTTRQREVVRLVRTGIPYKSVAEQLYVSEKTVQKHMEHIYQKVGVTNKTELMNKFMQNQ